jgi:predicted neutral ceramidase superfamily lipid hydrolase
MKTQKFFLGGIAGGIADFLLGWLFYGILFSEFLMPEGQEPSMGMIFAGCMSFGFLIAYIVVYLSTLTTFMAGLKAGALIGFFMGCMQNFFSEYCNPNLTLEKFLLDVAISVVIGMIVTGIVAAVNGRGSKINPA